MAQYTPLTPTGSTNGRPVKVAATSIGSGTTFHTAISGNDAWDEITVNATNTDTVPRSLTIGWGGTTDPDDLICKTVVLPALSGPINITDGLRLNGGLIVKAAASVANVVLLTGNVNRYQ